jgi:glycosyltransferase involved in cell wall biosynthesis
MRQSPFFTVLTASLNNGKNIKNTLTSVKEQRLQDSEHIVIDGGSKDNTLRILTDYSEAPALRWRSEPDRGISHALNKGIQLAKGRYILIIHGDDRLLDENVFSRAYNQLRNEPVDICSYPVLKETPNGRLMPYRAIRLRCWYHFKTILPHQGCFVHRKVFEHVGQFRENFTIALDYDFFYRAISSGATLKFGPQPVAIMGGSGISSNPAMLKKRLHEEALVQRMNEKRLSWRLAQRLFHLLYYPYKTRLAPRLF